MQLRICSVITLTLAVDKVVLQMLNWGNALIFCIFSGVFQQLPSDSYVN